MSTDLERALDTAAREAEENPDAPIQSGSKVTRGHGRSRTLQVRLNDGELAAVERAAEALGLPASTMVRDWVLDRLQPPRPPGDTAAVMARLEADMRDLRRIVSA